MYWYICWPLYLFTSFSCQPFIFILPKPSFLLAMQQTFERQYFVCLVKFVHLLHHLSLLLQILFLFLIFSLCRFYVFENFNFFHNSLMSQIRIVPLKVAEIINQFLNVILFLTSFTNSLLKSYNSWKLNIVEIFFFWNVDLYTAYKYLFFTFFKNMKKKKTINKL